MRPVIRNRFFQATVIFGLGIGIGFKYSDQINALKETDLIQTAGTAYDDVTASVHGMWDKATKAISWNQDTQTSKPGQYTVEQRAALAEIGDYLHRLDSDSEPEQRWTVFRIVMDEDHLNYEDLDPTGTKTRAEMRADIEQKFGTAYLRIARQAFNKLKSSDPYTDPYSARYQIDKYLGLAKKDYGALDESGRKTASEVEVEIASLSRDMDITRARETFAGLSNSKIPSTAIYMIDMFLRDAGADHSMLDPTGNKTDEQMRDEIRARVDTAVKLLALSR
jgi:hypothetical protein